MPAQSVRLVLIFVSFKTVKFAQPPGPDGNVAKPVASGPTGPVNIKNPPTITVANNNTTTYLTGILLNNCGALIELIFSRIGFDLFGCFVPR